VVVLKIIKIFIEEIQNQT